MVMRSPLSGRAAALAGAAALALALAACEGESTAQRLADARAALDKNDTAAAVISLKNTLADAPDSSEARLLLGRALLRSGDAAAALVELQKVAGRLPDEQVLPDLARAMLATGESAALLGQFATTTLREPAAAADLKTSVATAHAARRDAAAARDAATQALRLKPDLATAAVLLAGLDADEGQLDPALSRVDEVLRREPGHENAGLLKAQLLRAKGQPDGALAALKAVLDANPGSVAARATTVELLLQQNKIAEARTALSPLVQKAPKHPMTVFLQARLAFDERDHAACRAALDQLLASDKVGLPVLMLAAANEFALGRMGLAEAHLTRVLKAAPQALKARQLLARVYLNMGQPDRGAETLRPVVESASADAQSLALYGQAQLAAGDSAKAQQTFERAARLAPDNPRLRTGAALAQFARGDTAAALSQLEKMAQADGADAVSDLALVSLRMRQRDLPGALRAVQGWLKKSPDNADALSLQGRLLAQSGDLRGATASYERVLAKVPTHLPSVSGLAEMDLRADRRDQARQRLEALLKADPRNARTHLVLAEVEMRLGAPDAVVIKRLREAVSVDPTLAPARQLLVERLLGSGDAAGAVTAAQEAQAARSDDPSMLALLARAQIAAGEGQNAVTSLRKLITLQPRQPMHHVWLAEAMLLLKDKAGAADAVRQALKIDPVHLAALRAQALLAIMDKRPDDAVAIARGVQKRLPNDVTGLELEAELEAAAQRWPAAAAAYGQALQRAPSTTLAVRQHAALIKAGKAADAERLAADWLKRHADDSAFLYHLGDTASAAEDWAGAEARYRAVLKLNPRHAGAVNNVAWLLAKQGKPGALAMAEQAAELLPDRAPVLDTLALALESEKQFARAVEVQRRATELAPKNPDLRLRLAQLLAHHGDKAEARAELERLLRLGRGYPRQAEVAALLKTL